MGSLCGGASALPQALLLGLEGSGKSVFLEADEISSQSATVSTLSYKTGILNVGELSVQFWDVGGKDALIPLWPAYYRNIFFSAVVFLVDVQDTEKFSRARRELYMLTNEEELREAVFMVILNMKSDIELQSLDYYKEELNFSMIHPSVKIDAFVVNVKGRTKDYKQAMAFLEKQLKIKTVRKTNDEDSL